MDEKSIEHVQEGIYEFLKILGAHFPGDLTLNQIRVLQYVHLNWRYRKTSTTHAEICAELELPSATVSRSVAKFLELRLLDEQIDPADGRRRLIEGTGVIPRHPGDLDHELAELAERQDRKKANW